jgi:hypothetical protein
LWLVLRKQGLRKDGPGTGLSIRGTFGYVLIHCLPHKPFSLDSAAFLDFQRCQVNLTAPDVSPFAELGSYSERFLLNFMRACYLSLLIQDIAEGV